MLCPSLSLSPYLSVSTSPQPAIVTVGGSEGWGVCLVKCGEVLGSCVEVLRGVEEENLLQEIATSEEASNKLHGQWCSE